MKRLQRKLLRAGYREVHGHAPWVYLKIRQRGDWMVGSCVIIANGAAISFGATYDMRLATQEAVGAAGYEIGYEIEGCHGVEIGAFGKRFRKFAKRFRRRFRKRINKAARRIARAKVMRQLRVAYRKALQSPVASYGIKAASQALQAFGVPKPVTAMALNQARYAAIDRSKQGGWAGFVQRGTGKGGDWRTMLREGARRQARVAPKSARATLRGMLPGGGMGQSADMLRGLGQGFGQLVSGEDGDDVGQIYLAHTPPAGVGKASGYERPYLRGWYGQ